jgi:hypothetical protein
VRFIWPVIQKRQGTRARAGVAVGRGPSLGAGNGLPPGFLTTIGRGAVGPPAVRSTFPGPSFRSCRDNPLRMGRAFAGSKAVPADPRSIHPGARWKKPTVGHKQRNLLSQQTR